MARIDARALERELAAVLKDRSPGEVRSMLLSLVSYGEGGSLVDELVGRRPARLISIIPSEAAESSARVSARCVLDREERAVCLEEIVIEAGADGAGLSAGTWAPLLIRELPAVLWYGAELEGLGSFSAEAQGSIDLCVLRSGGGVPAARILDGIGMPLADLSWESIAAPRRAVARLFDMGSMLSALGSIDAISVGAPSGEPVELFAAWLLDAGFGGKGPALRLSRRASWRVAFFSAGKEIGSIEAVDQGYRLIAHGAHGAHGKEAFHPERREKPLDAFIRLMDFPEEDPLYRRALRLLASGALGSDEGRES